MMVGKSANAKSLIVTGIFAMYFFPDLVWAGILGVMIGIFWAFTPHTLNREREEKKLSRWTRREKKNQRKEEREEKQEFDYEKKEMDEEKKEQEEEKEDIKYEDESERDEKILMHTRDAKWIEKIRDILRKERKIIEDELKDVSEESDEARRELKLEKHIEKNEIKDVKKLLNEYHRGAEGFTGSERKEIHRLLKQDKIFLDNSREKKRKEEHVKRLIKLIRKADKYLLKKIKRKEELTDNIERKIKSHNATMKDLKKYDHMYSELNRDIKVVEIKRHKYHTEIRQMHEEIYHHFIAIHHALKRAEVERAKLKRAEREEEKEEEQDGDFAEAA